MNERFMFRVWDPKKKEYCPDNVMICKDGTLGLPTRYAFDDCDFAHMVVEQCLGLQDRNGKLIYQGDKLQKIVKNGLFKLGNFSDMECLNTLREEGKIIDESEDDSFVEATYRDIMDMATTDRFPGFWLKNESFGYEGEDLESPEDWEIVGNIHETEAENAD